MDLRKMLKGGQGFFLPDAFFLFVFFPQISFFLSYFTYVLINACLKIRGQISLKMELPLIH